MAKASTNAAGLRPLYSFDQLVIGPNNHVATAACHEVINKPGETYNPLFIFGPSGVGKTHLIQATAHEIIRKDPHCKVRYISAERFVSEILMAISEDKVLDLRKEYSQLDLLIIDDVQYLSESKMSQDELFHVFNNMHELNKQVILAADRPPNQLTALNKNIRSRLEWGLAADVAVPDEPTRLEILRKKQEIQGLNLSHEMLVYVARMLRSNVRELEGFLKRIHAYVTLSHQEVNLELVQAVLKEILPESAVGLTEEALPIRTVDKPRQPVPPPPARSAVEKSVPVEPVSITSLPPNGNSESFDLILDSIDLNTAEAVERPVSKQNPGAPAVEPAREVSPPPENGKNGHHKTGRVGRDPEARPPADISLPPPSLPSSAPSNLSFDILLESMSISSPEGPPNSAPPSATTKQGNAAATPTSPVKPAGRVPAPAVEPLLSSVSGDAEDDADLPSGYKEVGVVFFYPEGCKEALQTVQRKFQEVIKKHKLKFRMKLVHNEPYSFKGKINYSSFVDVCKANKVPVAVVIGPPPDTFIPEQDFYDLLTVTLDVQGVSLQLVNWGEISKDYRYLNLALDIALVRAR